MAKTPTASTPSVGKKLLLRQQRRQLLEERENPSVLKLISRIFTRCWSSKFIQKLVFPREISQFQILLSMKSLKELLWNHQNLVDITRKQLYLPEKFKQLFVLFFLENLTKHAVSEGTKAITKFTSSSA